MAMHNEHLSLANPPAQAKTPIMEARYRFEERVQRLMKAKGLDRAEAEEIVCIVITTKEAQ